jgi:hypothetical protein
MRKFGEMELSLSLSLSLSLALCNRDFSVYGKEELFKCGDIPENIMATGRLKILGSCLAVFNDGKSHPSSPSYRLRTYMEDTSAERPSARCADRGRSYAKME